jgi:hypothetical protein
VGSLSTQIQKTTGRTYCANLSLDRERNTRLILFFLECAENEVQNLQPIVRPSAYIAMGLIFDRLSQRSKYLQVLFRQVSYYSAV